MAVCITGMHRSGTSMVARMLNLAGLYLGAAEEMMPASDESPDGYWENAGFVRLNSAILNRVGGGWDMPPAAGAAWDEPALDVERAAASELLSRFTSHQAWGWKDPRTSITLPFWRRLVPDCRIIVCVRNPLEVALSLKKRGDTSYQLSLSLWKAYNERLLAASEGMPRLVTEYRAYFESPAEEIARLLEFAGLESSPDVVAESARWANVRRRHNRFETRHLFDAEVHPDIVNLYSWLCEEAGGSAAGRPFSPAPRPESPAAPGPVPVLRSLDSAKLEPELLRREIVHLRGGVELRDQRLADAAEEVAAARARVEEVEAEIAEARRALVEEKERRVAEQREEVERITERYERLLVATGEAVMRSLYEQEDRQSSTTSATPKEVAYRRLIARVRETVREFVPIGGTVAVVSRGDDVLLRLFGRLGLHFPQLADGTYAGHYPANSRAAIVQVERMRALGAEYLLFPETSSWWLDHYEGLASHLQSRYAVVARVEGTCILYSLRPVSRALRTSSPAAADDLDRLPDAWPVLDWTPTGGITKRLHRHVVFSSPGSDPRLPYLDASVDVVAVPSGDPERLEEARRVATKAVVLVDADDAAPGSTRIEWKDEEPRRRAAATVILAWRGPPDPAHLEHLTEEIQAAATAGCAIVVRSGAREWVERAAPASVVFDADQGISLARNLAASEAVRSGAEAVIFLDGALLPVSRWLSSLVETLDRMPCAAAVGGRVIGADEALAHAGAVAFCDGSLAAFGAGDPDPDAYPYSYVRAVDHCPSALLAVRGGVFEALGGFDATYSSLSYAEADLGMRLRAEGYSVIYQPASTAFALHDEGDEAAAWAPEDRQRFIRRWGPDLDGRLARPSVLDSRAWRRLATSPLPPQPREVAVP